MYTPPAFRETDESEIERIMQEARLPILVTVNRAGLVATHLPLRRVADPAPHGKLIGHIARANAQWRDLDPAAEALAIFPGIDAYVSPRWYATKRETGKVVPTWNYEAVHVYGRLEIVEDRDRLHAIVDDLTGHHERGAEHPWHVDDAPADFVTAQLKGIVGLVLTIGRIEGKRKLSQNRNEADRRGAIEGLAEAGEDAMAAAMRRLFGMQA